MFQEVCESGSTKDTSRMVRHLSITDLSRQQHNALVASTAKSGQHCSATEFFFFSLCRALLPHPADLPPAAQSDTQPLQGHHLFSSIAAIMDNFLESGKLDKHRLAVLYCIISSSSSQDLGKPMLTELVYVRFNRTNEL